MIDRQRLAEVRGIIFEAGRLHPDDDDARTTYMKEHGILRAEYEAVYADFEERVTISGGVTRAWEELLGLLGTYEGTMADAVANLSDDEADRARELIRLIASLTPRVDLDARPHLTGGPDQGIRD